MLILRKRENKDNQTNIPCCLSLKRSIVCCKIHITHLFRCNKSLHRNMVPEILLWILPWILLSGPRAGSLCPLETWVVQLEVSWQEHSSSSSHQNILFNWSFFIFQRTTFPALCFLPKIELQEPGHPFSANPRDCIRRVVRGIHTSESNLREALLRKEASLFESHVDGSDEAVVLWDLHTWGSRETVGGFHFEWRGTEASREVSCKESNERGMGRGKHQERKRKKERRGRGRGQDARNLFGIVRTSCIQVSWSQIWGAMSGYRQAIVGLASALRSG